jgi:hypothetical protein
VGDAGTLTVEIADGPAASIDDPIPYIRQLYHDALNREPTADELQERFYLLSFCAVSSFADCVHNTRISAATQVAELSGSRWIFALAQLTYGGFPSYPEYALYHQLFHDGALAPETDTTMPGTRSPRHLIEQWMRRPDFVAAFGSLPDRAYVDALIARVPPPDPYPMMNADSLTRQLASGALTRADVLELAAGLMLPLKTTGPAADQYYTALVHRSYYLYLRRAPDSVGLANWLATIKAQPEMAEWVLTQGFVDSAEYRARFGLN